MSDAGWKLPEGFEPVMRRDPSDPSGPGRMDLGLARLPDPALPDIRRYVFWTGEQVPKLPLRDKGELWHSGWDIPTRYAVDAEGSAWMDDAHGHPLEPVDAGRLVANAEDEETRRRLQRVLGLPVNRPAWVLAALAHGWTPPPDWKDPD